MGGCAWGWKSAKVTQLEEEQTRLKGQLEASEKARQELLAQVNRLQGDLNRIHQEHAREIQRLTEEKAQAAQRAAEEKERQAQSLLAAQHQLAESLKKELANAQAKLEMTERGLVLTFLDEIFFDSGKAVIKSEGLETLRKVAQVLKETVPDSPVAIEGHTDNEPIKYSGWKSNWELSAARALAVLHHFVDQHGLDPVRLRAVCFGEYHPVASNDTAEGRRQNRRVEIVILPKEWKKVRN
jgi:chemotaxis protein MotB